ncbi:hypothetical protein Ddye_019816 [Dipteronia dyeriana]|uniref:Reverse transcriptase zinc-binding domain-containing protein n=1 Tax=Dipteronia dyeriana TaxID=168575 RepID=A0AAD9TYN6_9ROSI|nr:hypothetical protein Ddye_019816 [Dipteronia dyeriana]
MLNEVLLPIDKESVLSISLSWRISHVFLLWQFDKSGVHTVQNGYLVASSISLEASASNSRASSKWWNTLWSLHLPPKIRIFVWRACLNVLPSMEMWWKKKVVESPCCQRHGKESETSIHALFGCKEATIF